MQEMNVNVSTSVEMTGRSTDRLQVSHWETICVEETAIYSNRTPLEMKWKNYYKQESILMSVTSPRTVPESFRIKPMTSVCLTVGPMKHVTFVVCLLQEYLVSHLPHKW